MNLMPGTFVNSPASISETMLELDPALDSGDSTSSPIVWQSMDPSNPARLVGGPVTKMSELTPCGGSTPLSTDEMASMKTVEGASSRLTRAGWRLPAGTLCMDLVRACGGNTTAAQYVAGKLGPNTLGQCNWNRGEVVWAGKPLTLARWPNTFEATPPPPPPTTAPNDAATMAIVQSRLQAAGIAIRNDVDVFQPPSSYPSTVRLFNWSNIEKASTNGFTSASSRPTQWATECNGADSDCWVHGYWTYGWADSYVRIATVQSSGSSGSSIATDPNTPPVYGFKDRARWYGVSILSELDAPGEYYVDASALKVYVLPPTGAEPTDEVVVTGTPTLISSPSTSQALARHEAEATAALVKSHNYRGDDYATARRRWEQHGRAAGMAAAAQAERKGSTPSGLSFVVFGNLTMVAARNGLTLSDTQNVVVIRVSATAMTKTAVSVEGSDSFLVHVDGSDCGCAPMHMGGGDETSLTPSGSAAYNVTAMQYSRLIRTYNPGMSWSGVGTVFAANTFAFAPHQAWLGGGNDNVFAGSTVNLLCFEVSDSGAWYSGRSWARRNNTLVGNLFGNIVNLETPVLGSLSIQAVYNDDELCANVFAGNIFYNNHKAMFIGGGRRHVVYNNSFYDAGIAVHIDDRGLTWQKDYCNPINGTFIEELRSLNYQQPPWSVHYPELVNITSEFPCVPVYNSVTANCQSGSGNFTDFTAEEAADWKETIQSAVPSCKPLPQTN